MWILNEIKKNKTKKVWKYAVFIGIIVFAAVIYLIFFKNSNSVSVLKSYSVTKKDITSTFSADWNVKFKEQYDLDFPVSGILAKVFKNEWDIVKKWDLIAMLDDKYLKIDLDKANLVLNKAQANLDSKLTLKWWSSDINISQKQLDSSVTSLNVNINQWKTDVENALKTLSWALSDLENAKTSTQYDMENSTKTLESRQKDLENANDLLQNIIAWEALNIKNSKTDWINLINASISSLEKYLRDSDIIIWATDQNKNTLDSIRVYLWAKNESVKNNALKSFNNSLNNLNSFESDWTLFKSSPDLSKVNPLLDRIQNLSKSVNDSLIQTRELLKNSIVSSSFPQSTLDSMISNIESDINLVETQIQNITNSIQNIDTAELSLTTKTLNQQDTIKSLVIQVNLASSALEKSKISAKTSIDDFEQKYSLAQNNFDGARVRLENNVALANAQIWVSQANLDAKKTWLEPFYTDIDTAKKWIDEAQKRLNDSRLYSPIDWKIWRLSITKPWTIVNINPAWAFVTIINKNSLYIEAKIEEWDISNIYKWQKVNVSFNSLENVNITWRVSYISDKSETDINNIVTYKVEISLDSINESVKEWFTAQLYFVLNIHRNVLAVPLETVKEENWKSYIVLKNWLKQEVTTWIDDWDYVEIKTWLKMWDIISY